MTISKARSYDDLNLHLSLMKMGHPINEKKMHNRFHGVPLANYIYHYDRNITRRAGLDTHRWKKMASNAAKKSQRRTNHNKAAIRSLITEGRVVPSRFRVAKNNSLIRAFYNRARE